MENKVIKVNLGKNSYNITIGRGSLSHAEKYLNLKRKVLIVTDDNIPKKYIQKIKSKSQKAYIVVIKHGEENKNYKNYLKIMQILISYRFDRSDAIVAIGGGMVGDMAGFAASTYMRGIDFYNVPTTLLSQVDSSIGGKTAINATKIKNIIGTFYQPKGVLIDTDVLKTLPKRELNSGIVESIKMAATFDKNFFRFLCSCDDIIKNSESIIYKSLILKKRVVEKDEKEKGLRKVLNFGHTIGHAIEESMNYKLLHGECVGIGMLFFSNKEAKSKIESALLHYNLPTSCKIDKRKIIKLIKHDKKAKNDMVSTIQVDKIGSYKIINVGLHDIAAIL